MLHKSAFDDDDAAPAADELTFVCSLCGLHSKFEYFGTQPPFLSCIRFKEETYIRRDPFQPHDKKDAASYLQLGAHCALCDRVVCVDGTTCSVYYGKRLCRLCAFQNQAKFPSEIQTEILKMQKLAEAESAKQQQHRKQVDSSKKQERTNTS